MVSVKVSEQYVLHQDVFESQALSFSDATTQYRSNSL